MLTVKSLFNCACLLLALLSLSSAANSPDIQIHARQNLNDLNVRLSVDEQAWLRHKNTLIVGILDSKAPPYRLINERNELEGIGADNLSALQRDLAIPIRLKTYPSAAAAFEALKTGEVDMVDSSTQIEAEDFKVALSPPYAFTELALFAESGDLHDYSRDMTNVRVAATDGMALELYQRTGGKGLIKRYSTPLAAMASLLSGESQVYLGDTLATHYVSNQLFSNQLVVNHSARLPEIQVGFAVAPDNLMLQGILERTLGSLKRCQIIRALAEWSSTQTCDLSSFLDRLDSAERSWINQSDPLRLVISEDLAPYVFFNARGRLNGIASDLLDIVRRKTGLRFEIIRVTSLSDVQTQLRKRQADLSVMTEVNHGESSYLFTRPFITTPYVLLQKKDAAPAPEVNADFTGTLAFASGQLAREDLAKRYPRLRLEETRTMADALNRTRDGKVDYAVAPANMARYYLAYKYENLLKISGMLAIADARVAFVASKDHPLLISIMDKALSEISPQEYLQIIGRWRANSATDDKYWEGVTSFIWKSLGILCLLLTVAGYWIYTQRQRILRKQQDLLQRQLLLDQLQVAKEAAETASRSKSVFLATMSHEIRTPLNAIIGMLELVLTRKDDSELNTQSVHIAYDSAHSLLALIGDILDISRIESGKQTLHPEPANLHELIESVRNVFMGLARQKNLDLQLELDTLARQPVWIDGLKFKQVLSNLVSNAIKFTEQGSVVIQCQAQAVGDNSINVRVSVTDTGSGIPASQIQQVFTPFFELDSAINTPNAGAGLGLSISQSLSHLMNATLSLESEVGVGTCLLFSGRFERVSEKLNLPQAPQPTVTTTIERPLTVLIVEDHLPSQYLLSQQIRYLGHQTITASNGVEGLAQWQAHEVDIILTDCNMPEMGGHEMAQAIRRLEAQLGLRPCTLIGLTASAQPQELERCLRSGMDHALVKPVGLAHLNRLIPKRHGAGSSPGATPPSLNTTIKAALAARVVISNQHEQLALRAALEHDDRPALNAIAHKLKGTAYLLNAQGLLELCQYIEELVAQNAPASVLNEAVTQLEQALMTLSTSLQTH